MIKGSIFGLSTHDCINLVTQVLEGRNYVLFRAKGLALGRSSIKVCGINERKNGDCGYESTL